MEAIFLILLIVGIIILVVGVVVDESSFMIFGIIFICASAFFIPLLDTDDDHVVTIQQIEYAVNKCSSFGGLKEIRNDDIICMDKTKIKNEFKPEKKVEAE